MLPSQPVRASSELQLRNVKRITSYSWVWAPTPSIAVPGYPCIWRTITVKTVPADDCVDCDVSFMGHCSPLIPIFAAVDLLLDDLQYHDSDLVTDENNLRELLRCIDRRHDKSFCIDLDLLGKTCLFSCLIRHEEASIKEFRGYGHECEVGATKPRRGSEDGISHHRVISYDFGGLKVLLRCEDDSFPASLFALSIGTKAASTLMILPTSAVSR